MTNPITHSAFEIDTFSNQDIPDSIKRLRQQVFVHEQKVPAELEWDELDSVAIHFGIREKISTHYIGCARLLEQPPGLATIGRMAVTSANRLSGIGQQLLHHAVTYCLKRLKCHTITLDSQLTAIPFYQKSGFLCISDQYMEAGIAHRKMSLLCPNNFIGALQDNQLPRHYPSPFHSDADTHSWFFSTPELSRELLTAFAVQAREAIEIQDPTLEPDIFDCPMFVDYVSRMARKSTRAQVRVLLQDDKNLAHSRHSLVELAKRLPSRISIRISHSSGPDLDSAFVLADRNMLLFRKDPNSPEGFANFSRPDKVKPLRDSFNEAWRRSRRSREFNTFGL